MSIIDKIIPGKWERSGNGVFVKGQSKSVAIITLHKADMRDNSEAAYTAEAIAKVPEMLHILNRFYHWYTVQTGNKESIKTIVKDAIELLNELNK